MAPHTEPPPGYKMVPIAGRQLCRTVAFRITDEEEALLEELRDSMPGGKMSEALRWLLNTPVIREAILAQIGASRHG